MKHSKTKWKLLKKKKKTSSKCKWCNKTFYKEHNRQEYCSNKCKDYARLECTSKRVNKYRKKYDKKYSDWVGTGHLGQHKVEDEETEHDLIKKELSRLGLKKKEI